MHDLQLSSYKLDGIRSILQFTTSPVVRYHPGALSGELSVLSLFAPKLKKLAETTVVVTVGSIRKTSSIELP